jgi:hypothetical protein
VGGHGTPDTHGTHNSSNANEQTSAPLLLPQSPCAILRDHGAHSDDIVIPINLGASLDRVRIEHNWEYQNSRWLPAAAAADFVRDHAGLIIPPSLALLRWMGLTGRDDSR